MKLVFDYGFNILARIRSHFRPHFFQIELKDSLKFLLFRNLPGGCVFRHNHQHTGAF
jgi:hypothetical protein